MRSKAIDIVVLAAGKSTRTGTVNKLLVHFNGKPLVKHGIDAALKSKANHVRIVTGYQQDQLREILNDYPVTFVYNSDYALGIGASIQCALNSLPKNIDGVILCLADMPFIATHHFNSLIDNFDGDSLCGLYFNAERGHPILFPKRWFRKLTQLHESNGAKSLLRDSHEKITRILVPSDAIFRDIDKLDDFRITYSSIND
ncbi:MAG: hypothetical protein CL398_11845 [Acidiferrobacteraceae bacterium]|nr:hypothetical protein [Acidiferrobacteraceae bacterium]|tara:strand:- start:2296 stop:2895 length:600 start_codon:yes stop_codon:yes gene_type:complete